MSQEISANKRIAKNTLLLYVRMLFTMGVSLYTSRVVLNTLGVEDFGIYNVVGGVVAMFGFINGAMTTSTQRYLTFELGKGNQKKLHLVFSTSVLIHALIALLILLFSITLGLWFLTDKMVIPADRMEASLWVFVCSILSTLVLIMSVPYNACIIAHEKMSAFAYISVIEVTLKLAVVYLLALGEFDRLKLYAVLLLAIQCIIRFIYGRYCSHHFPESRGKLTFNKSLFKEMVCFAGWNLWGNCAIMGFTHGINVLLNIFFNPVVNAARAIAVQVQAAVALFASNFQSAINPQITKQYANDNLEQMHNLIFKSSRLTFFLLLLLTLPILIKTETVLVLWLNDIPDNTVAFVKLLLCITIIDTLSNPLAVSAASTGMVRLYQSVVGGIFLTILPISYICLKLGFSVYSVFIVHLAIAIVVFFVRLFIVRPLIKLSIRSYLRIVLLRCVAVLGLSVPLPFILSYSVGSTILQFLVFSILTAFSVCLSVYLIGLEKSERVFLNERIQYIHNKYRR